MGKIFTCELCTQSTSIFQGFFLTEAKTKTKTFINMKLFFLQVMLLLNYVMRMSQLGADEIERDEGSAYIYKACKGIL